VSKLVLSARFENAVDDARQEAARVEATYGDFSSMHEAYGVLAEEVDEFFRAVKMRQTDTQRPGMLRQEAIQIASTALRIAEQVHRVTK